MSLTKEQKDKMLADKKAKEKSIKDKKIVRK